MDFQRNILIVALLVVSYFLFLSWQQDYAQQPPQDVAAVTAGAAATPATGSHVSPATPGIPAPVSAGEFSDIAPISQAPDAPATTTGTASASRITVHTDVLDLAIDLAGGDVVELTLPKYSTSLEHRDTPVRLMTTQGRTYVAQSGLVSDRGPDLPDGQRASYTADAARFELADGQDTLEVVLHLAAKDGVAVDKVFRFRRGDYLVDVIYRLRNDSAQPWNGFLFGQLKRDGYGDPSHPDAGFLSATPTYLGGAYFSDEQTYNKTDFSDVQEKPLKLDAQGGWIAFIQHYFIGAWIPAQQQRNTFFTRYRADEGSYMYGFSSGVTVPAGASQEIQAGFYAGPKLQDRLEEISTGLDLTVDYGWFWFIAQPLFWLLVQLHALFGNWGVAIILLTVAVKILFYYPSHVSYRSMAHMRRITPELMRLREEYKNDRQKQAQEMMNLYRKEKVNPLGGCLPILVQMPVFIALYWVLLESVELRQAPFMLWIHDLSVMDPYFVLPILMGISMWIQMKLNPAPPDPMQAKMMQWLPWIFTVFFLFFASGLVLYWLVNNILSIAQQWYITRQIERQHAKA
ncbi:MAG: membrane protein insertase YidC [Pseudomonadota bacterium]